MGTEPTSPLLTAAQVIRWRDERIALAAEIEGLQEKLSILDRKLDAVALLLPDAARELLHETSEEDAAPIHQRAWTDIVLALIEGEQGGRTARWFRETILNTPELAKRHEASPTGLHNALSRLAIRGELEKRGNLYYSPETLNRIHAGELEEDEEEGDTYSVASILNALLSQRPDGMTAGDLVAEARKHPTLKTRAERSTTFVYSFLSREAFRHRLVKDGDVYRFPSKRDGAPSADAEDAPTAGGVAAPPNENQGRFDGVLG